MPRPGGTAPAAPSVGAGPGAAAWASMSQYASVIACQMPLRLGLPSEVRGARYAAVWPAASASDSQSAAATATVVSTDRVNRFRI